MSSDKGLNHLADYETISQADLPSGRKGKHHSMLVHVLENLERLADGRALRVPLKDCEGTAADVRAAIFRATSKRGLEIATSSDDEFFYVWKPPKRNGKRI